MSKVVPAVKHAKDAADALVRLNSFGAILALTESGLFPGGDPVQVGQINAICKRAIQRELKKYDAALGRLS